MSKSKHTVAIGVFVVGALGILVLATMIFSQGFFGTDKERGVLVFRGSVKGLQVGAPVAFKGVEIGKVLDVDLLLDTDTYEVMMPVVVEIDNNSVRRSGSNADKESLDHLIANGFRGTLQTQSLLTGLLYVEFDMYPDAELNYADIKTDYVQLPTIPTDMEKLSRNLQDVDFEAVFSNLQESLAGIDHLINNPSLQNLPQQLDASLSSIQSLAAQMQKELERSGYRVAELLDNTNMAVEGFNAELPKLADSVDVTLENLDDAIGAFETTMNSVDYTLSPDSQAMYELIQAARELGAAGRSLQSLAAALEETPESLLRGRSPQED